MKHLMPERRTLVLNPGIWITATLVAALLIYFGYTSAIFTNNSSISAGDVTNTTQPIGSAETQNSIQGPVELGPSGLPLPRFVSLKSDRVNVRVGPSQDHAIAWVFRRQGLPIEIIAEFENWRQIRDSDGAEGWVIQSLLSGRRTVLVAPWSNEASEIFPLRDEGQENANLVARLEKNVLASLLECENDWCRISVQEIDGWVQRNLLWGVGPNEAL
jgi:SH3-like domain-containing protein